MPVSAIRLALLAVARKRLAMADDDYRRLLLEHGGVESARDLDARGFDAVMARFRQLGFVSEHYRAGYGGRSGMASPHQVRLIRDLWLTAVDQPTEAHLRNWLAKTFKVSDLRFVDGKTAPKVITALTRMKVHRALRAGRGG